MEWGQMGAGTRWGGVARWEWRPDGSGAKWETGKPDRGGGPYLVPYPPFWYPMGRTAWHETTLKNHQSEIQHSLIKAQFKLGISLLWIETGRFVD